MKKLLLFCSLYAIVSVSAFGQSDRRSVLESDMSGAYKKAVKDSFYKTLNENHSLSKGYHGMFDFGYAFGVGDYQFGRFEINTVHGYQFNPYVFLGGGLGLHIMEDYASPAMDIPLDVRKKNVDVPLFADGRITFIESNITPYVDGRLGYYLTHSGGIYANISVGVRFATWDRQAINLSFGYVYENLQFQTFDKFTSSNSMHYTRHNRNLNAESLNIKIGYEF